MRVNRAQLASIMGWSLPTVDARVREGCPYISKPGAGNKKGGTWEFETADVIAWLVKKVTEPLDGNTPAARKAEIELRTAEVDLTIREMKMFREQEETVFIDEVAKVFGENLAVSKSRLVAIPGRLAQAVAVETDPATCRRLIKAEIDEALDEISSFHLGGRTVVPLEPSGEASTEGPPPEPEDPFDGY